MVNIGCRAITEAILQHKLITLLTILCTVFLITTIVFGTEKASLDDDLWECEANLRDLRTNCENQTETTTLPPITEIIDYRLPGNVKPSHYELFLYPDLSDLPAGQNATFKGEVMITIEILEKTDIIVLHSNLLTILAVKFQDNSKTFTFDKVKEFLIVELGESVDIGTNYKLFIEFSGDLANKIVGFYTSSYFDVDTSKTVKIASSKFEPTYARQAFPCFDEPQLKATFQISIVHPTANNYHALSNMDIESEESYEGSTELNVTRFRESVPMSTYLACFIVSDFQFNTFNVFTDPEGKAFDIRVYSTPSQLDKIEFAGKVGAGVLKYYLDYFNIAFPLPKLDMAAIPDYVSGATEHWGLVTYRETALLYSDKISSTINKKRVAAVIAHELAHSWFGNLVTMKWWDELWLNEGFASYIEFKGINYIQPQWKMMDQFLIDDLHGVLVLDATLGSHPIVQTVENPDQITEIFDTITYSKGASIIRMLEDFVGESVFQQGVHNYLKAHEYGNAETTDLLNQIEKLDLDPPNLEVTSIVNTWIRQKGFPYLTVTRSDTDANVYNLVQKRFLIDPDSYDKETSEYMFKWDIPLTYFTDKNPTVRRDWFMRSDNPFKVTADDGHSWIKFNNKQIGYYRVNYPTAMWTTFTNGLIADVDTLSISDRTNLIDDSFSFAEAQIISYEIPMHLTKYLLKEREHVPWSSATSKLNKINMLLSSTNLIEKYQNYILTIIGEAYDYVGWEINTSDDEFVKNLVRTTILNLACTVGHEGCMKKVGEEFEKFLATPDVRPHPDLRSIVYYFGMASVGNSKNWEQMWKIFEVEEDASEKLKLMSGLCAIKDPSKLTKLIQLGMDRTDVIRSQDYFTLLGYIADNKVGEPLVWDFVRENWSNYLVERFTLNDRYLGQMVKTVTSKFASQLKLDEMNAFFTKYPQAGAGTASRAQALETVQNNINWLKRNKDAISKWLNDQKKVYKN